MGYPYKGASTIMDNTLYRIVDCSVENDVYIENRYIGIVIFMDHRYPVIVCGKGLLKKSGHI